VSTLLGFVFVSSDSMALFLHFAIVVSFFHLHALGKTTTSLAIVSGLKKRFDKVGFIKPVGQQHVEVKLDNGDSIRVDKDVTLVREHFDLKHLDYRYMSPVIIPRGYTKKYIDGEISHEEQLKGLHSSMGHVAEVSDVVVCEGTGHCAVGSIVGMNNAKVASEFGADMVLIANGGLGRYNGSLSIVGGQSNCVANSPCFSSRFRV
jgi:dethiobiotin synthetase